MIHTEPYRGRQKPGTTDEGKGQVADTIHQPAKNTAQNTKATGIDMTTEGNTEPGRHIHTQHKAGTTAN